MVNKTKFWNWILLGVGLLCLPITSTAQEKTKLVIMPIQNPSGKVDSKVTSSATRYLRGKLSSTKSFLVVRNQSGGSKLTKVIRKKKKESYQPCYDESCQIEIGKAVAADTVLRTKITYFDTCVLNVQLISVEKEATLKATQLDFDCSATGLEKAIDKGVESLAKVTVSKGAPWKTRLTTKGTWDWPRESKENYVVVFKTEPSGAIVRVDERQVCDATPCSKSLSSGKRKIQPIKGQYKTKRVTAEITGPREYNWELTPKFGLLRVTGKSYGAKVVIDDTVKTRIPTENIRLSPGTHKVVVKENGRKVETRRVRIKKGKLRKIDLNAESRR